MLSLRLEQLEMFCATQTHCREGSGSGEEASCCCDTPSRLSPACPHREHRSVCLNSPPRQVPGLGSPLGVQLGCRAGSSSCFGLGSSGAGSWWPEAAAARLSLEEEGQGQLQLWQMLVGERAEADGAGGC